MIRIRPILVLLPLLLNCACSTVLEGRSQQISIATSPAGAHCVVLNNGDVIAEVPSTPDRVTIPKSKNDILVQCDKEGYVTAKQKNLSDMAITSLGNMALWQLSFVGNAVDSATGAGHKYDSDVFITMNKAPAVVAQTQPASQPVGMTTATLNPHAQELARQLVAEVGQTTAAQSGGPVVLSQHTQELAQQLVQEATLPPGSVITLQ